MPMLAAILIPAAATLAAASDPAPRAPAPAALPAVALTTVAVAAAVAPADRPDQIYCIRDTFPESMTERTRCRRLADWQAHAIDPRSMDRVR